MIRKYRLPVVALLVSVGLSFAGCSDDDKAPEETVQTEPTETPAAPPEEAPAEPAPASFTPERVMFSYDDYTLSSDAQSTLNSLADYMKSNTAAVVQIEGHADERGSIEYNLALGERRAQSVKQYLTQLGVDAARLPTISYGEEKPIAEGHDEAAWSQNRRAEFVVSNP